MDNTAIENTPQGNNDAAAQAAADEAAFASGYSNEPTYGPTPSQASDTAGTDDQRAAAPADGQGDAAVDPYAGLPPNVREQLARIPTLEHADASNRGRIAALTRKLEALTRGNGGNAAATPPATPATVESLEKVRGELPEVAAAIEDAVKAAITGAKAPAEPAVTAPEQPPTDGDADVESGEAKVLRDAVPDWEKKLLGAPFQLWLTTQTPEYRAEVMRTGSAGVLINAFAAFDKARPGAWPPPQNEPQGGNRGGAANDVSARRAARAAAAVAPRGSVVSSSARSLNQLTDEEAFELGYSSPS